MVKSFDQSKNNLYISDTNGNIFDLEFKDLKTIVTGESATGKSLLCDIIRELQKDKNIAGKKYDVSDIILIDDRNMHEIKTMRDKLLIIDRADIILDKEAIEMINDDWGYNKYLIFSRSPIGIELSPNYFGDIYEDKGIFHIKYACDIGGWN